MALEDARLGHGRGQVQRGLAAEPGQQALRPLPGDDRLDRLDGERLEVDDVGHRRVGHDRGRVRVDQDRPDALGPQGAAGLGPGVVELGRLADDDRPGPEDQDRGGLHERVGHRAATPDTAATKRSNTASASSGPGAPSGWYWTVSIGCSRWRRPSTEPSLRLTWLTRKPDALRHRRSRRPGPRGSGRSPGPARARRRGPGGSRRGGRTGVGSCRRPRHGRRSGGPGRSRAAAGRRR